MKFTYKHTYIACCTGYVVQAVVNVFIPLLYAMFNTKLNITDSMLSIICIINFAVQILTDLSSAFFIPKIGYRNSMILSQGLCITGLILLGILPQNLPSAFVGVIISTLFLAVGGGLTEVLVSPMVQALPAKNKEKSMAFLHSFYCWGSALVVLLSTLFFKVAGIDNWFIAPFIWTIIPIFDLVLFIKVPIISLDEDKQEKKNYSALKNPIFWVMFVMMICAGASELAMSTWVSKFAELGLGVSKTVGDLLGPCLFALSMGLGRILLGILTDKVSIEKCLLICGVGCTLCYLGAIFFSNSILPLVSCGLTGLFVSLMWPGTYSLGAKKINNGGTFMFALYAFAGDIGCTSGSSLVGFIADMVKNGNMPLIQSILPAGLSIESQSIRAGLLICTIFPIIMLIGAIIMNFYKEKKQ